MDAGTLGMGRAMGGAGRPSRAFGPAQDSGALPHKTAARRLWWGASRIVLLIRRTLNILVHIDGVVIDDFQRVEGQILVVVVVIVDIVVEEFVSKRAA